MFRRHIAFCRLFYDLEARNMLTSLSYENWNKELDD